MNSIKIWTFMLIVSSGCYGVNQKTTEIGMLNSTCLQDIAWSELSKKYSKDNITSAEFKEGLLRVENYFLKPDYILYFQSGPEEIIGCDYYTVRTVFNPDISTMAIGGLDPSLSDNEQIRVRNRIQKLLMEYQCDKGRQESQALLDRPAPFSEQ